MTSTTVLVTVAAIAVWSGGALVLCLFLGRCISDPDHPEVELPGDEAWLDDQPTEVLADEALKQRFNKILIDNGIEDVR